ncbi:CPBP family intramembrane metalloprotease [Clostridium perfringens]
MNKINKKLQNLSNPQFIIFSFLSAIIYLIYNVLLSFIIKEKAASIIFNSTFLMIWCIFIAPFLETLIFQFAIIKIVKKLSKSYLLAIILSICAFNIAHTFSLIGHIAFIPISVFFAYIFYIYDEVNRNPFLRLSFIHFIINLTLIGPYLLLNL